MEQTYIAYIKGIGEREYFFRDSDEARAFERMFEGEIFDAVGGYKVVIA